MISTFFNYCNNSWGDYPAFTSIQNRTDSSKPLSKDYSDSFSPIGSSSIIDIAYTKDLSTEKESKELLIKQEISKCQEENDVDTNKSECDLLQPSSRCRKIEEILNKRKDERLITKFIQEGKALYLSREDFQLKKQLLQKFDKNDKRLQENLKRANAVMSNIGVAIQQSVAILGQLLAPRNQIPPNVIQEMHTPMNFQSLPQLPFQQVSSSSGTYSRRERGSNATNIS